MLDAEDERPLDDDGKGGGSAKNPVQEVGKSVCSRRLNHHAAASAVVMSCSQSTAAPHSRDTSRGMTSFDPGIYLDHNET